MPAPFTCGDKFDMIFSGDRKIIHVKIFKKNHFLNILYFSLLSG
jgi:hypothetical protein